MLNCKEFVNADSIAAGLSPFNPESVAIEAGRLMLLNPAVMAELEQEYRAWESGKVKGHGLLELKT